MGFKFNTGKPKPVMKVKELVSLLESSAKGPKKHLGKPFEIADVVIGDLDPGSYKDQYCLPDTSGEKTGVFMWRA